MKKMLRKLKSNSGFTLIELMVSVAIFAVIISPLLHSFLNAQQTSRRSHILGDATLASRNIVETVRAMGADAFLAANVNDYVRGEGTYTFDRLNHSEGMFRFDLRITLTTDGFDDINNMQITEYSPMHGVFAQPTGAVNSNEPNPDLLAETDLAYRATVDSGIEYTVEYMRDVFNREISVDVEILSEDTRAVTVTYLYSFGSVSYQWKREILRERICVPCEEICAIPHTEHINPCKTCFRCAERFVYVCYQPIFYRPDTIKINNTDNMNLTVFLVKQSDEIPGYNPNISIISGESNTRLFTNAEGGELVSRSQRDRMFGITVLVYRNGDIAADGSIADGVRPLLRFTASHLD
jgi:prepilin-type N-terminal cleavage/methylation domain-containing protein